MALRLGMFAAALALSFTTDAVLAAPVTHVVQTGDPLASVSATLNVSPVATAFFNVISASAQGLDGAGIDSTLTPRGRYATLAVNGLSLSAFSYDDVSGQLLSAQFRGGVDFERLADGFPEDVGQLALRNLRVDFTSQTVFADVTGSGMWGPSVNVEGLAVWRANGAQGTLQGLAAGELNVPYLAFTDEGFQAFMTNFSLLPDAEAALRKADSFGSITAVPEPGTTALVAMGLVGICALARRRTARAVTAISGMA